MNAIIHRPGLRRVLIFGFIAIFIGLCLLSLPSPLLAQAPPQPGEGRCYAVANVPQDRLYQIDPSTGIPSDVLVVHTAATLIEDPTDPQGGRLENAPTDIEALVFAPARSDPELLELYAASQRNFGVINLETAEFELIGNGFGTLGGVDFINVDGIAYFDGRMYGALRRRAPGVPDLLFEIDMETGAAKPDAFGPGVHYAEMKLGTLSDLDDIAFDSVSPYTLYGTMNEAGHGATVDDGVVLVEIDPANGTITLPEKPIVNGNQQPVFDIEGMTFLRGGELFGTSGYNRRPDLNRFYRIDKATANAVEVSNLGRDFGLYDTEAIACPPIPGVKAPAIQLVKYCQNADANDPNGPDVPVVLLGDDLTWTYEITNIGGVPLTNVTLTDDPLGSISCPKDTLYEKTDDRPGESMTCIFTAPANREGIVTNVGTVTGDGEAGPGRIETVRDRDPSHCRVVRPAIELVKYCQDVDANDPNGSDVPVVADGQTITWTYVIKNSGGIALDGISLTDDPLGSISCPKDSLSEGESMTCTQTGDTSVADANGLIANLGSVIGCAQGYTPCTGIARVSDEDPSHCRTTTTPPPYINVGSAMTFGWQYLVSDPVVSDTVDLQNVVLDPGAGIIVDPTPSSGDDIDPGILNVGETWTFDVSTPAQPLDRYSDLYTNIVTGTALSSADVQVQVSDTCGPQPLLFSNYLDTEVALNGTDASTEPGLPVNPGDPLTWTYSVTNTSPSTITALDVQQIAGTSSSDFVVATCLDTTLIAGQTTTCTIAGTALAGPVTTFGAVAGNVPVATDCEDPARTSAPVMESLLTYYSQPVPPVQVSGRVFGDFATRTTPANGIQDPYETGVAGVVVRLLNADDGTVASELSTDSTGAYAFSFSPGVYALQFEVPENHSLAGAPWTIPDQGSNDRLDSDVVPDSEVGAASVEIALSLAVGDVVAGVDAGLIVSYESLFEYLFMPLMVR